MIVLVWVRSCSGVVILDAESLEFTTSPIALSDSGANARSDLSDVQYYKDETAILLVR